MVRQAILGLLLRSFDIRPLSLWRVDLQDDLAANDEHWGEDARLIGGSARARRRIGEEEEGNKMNEIRLPHTRQPRQV